MKLGNYLHVSIIAVLNFGFDIGHARFKHCLTTELCYRIWDYICSPSTVWCVNAEPSTVVCSTMCSNTLNTCT